MHGRAKFRITSSASNKPRLASARSIWTKFNKLILFLFVFVALISLLGVLYVYEFSKNEQPDKLLSQKISKSEEAQENLNSYLEDSISLTPTPSERLTPTPTVNTGPSPIPTITPTPALVAEKGVATQIDENTWSVELKTDSTMANVNEIFQALNNYRTKRGVGTLIWDNNLASYAQSRASFFNSHGSLDSHAGFQEYMNNGGFEKSGFNGLGENSAFMAGPMTGTKIIESLFAADAPHDNNQTDPSWTHVGIGLSGNAVNVNFGKNKR